MKSLLILIISGFSVVAFAQEPTCSFENFPATPGIQIEAAPQVSSNNNSDCKSRCGQTDPNNDVRGYTPGVGCFPDTYPNSNADCTPSAEQDPYAQKRILCDAKRRAMQGNKFSKPPIQGKYRWSVGFDGKLQWARPNGDQWDQIISEFAPGFSIYLANRFTNIWSLELGYTWTNSQDKSFTSTPGEQIFGATATNSVWHNCKMRYKETYLDLYAHVPVGKSVELMIGPGIGFVRQSLNITHSPNVTTDPVVVALNVLESSTGATLRVNIGAQALWTERVGVRLLFSYETYSSLGMQNVNTAALSEHFSNDAITVLFGIYWNFTGNG